MVLNKEDIEWLINQVPWQRGKKVKKIKMIYNQREHGFNRNNFHKKCDGHPYSTITLARSKAGCIFGGYTSQIWASEGGHLKGATSFIFSLTSKLVYPQKTENSIYCDSDCGPSFGWCSLLIGKSEQMNEEDASYCYTNGYGDGRNYGIESDM